MFRRKIIGFVSEIGTFLTKFNSSHQNSPAQAAEIQKYQRINDLRDNPKGPTQKPEIWEEF